MISKDFFNTIEAVADERGLNKDQVLEAFEKGLIAGCKKAHGVRSCRVEIKEDKSEILLYKQYYVLDEDTLEEDMTSNPLNKEYTFITVEDAKEMKTRVKPGQLIEIKVDPKDFNLYAIKDFKNRFNEELTNKQKETIYNHFKAVEHEMVTARVTDVDDNYYKLELEKEMTTLLPKKEALPNDVFHVNDRIKVYITEVQSTTKWPKVFVSRVQNGLITRLLEELVPEIKEGIISIMGISRDAGDRSKIGVRSEDPKVDPIGACVGEGGQRIREIVKAISGEKIDLFRWSDNEQELIANALQPAKVVAVTKVNPKEKSALAIVPDDQLSLAIGKLGQNVKLAVQASGWSIDIKSETQAQQEGIIY
ncbi:Transcription termination factor NusA [Alteracholeplasma palmae J233]|uniref:Transcription termination/antitermination protein NusA n=2 Tax=Acholeplasma palmae TaxID=38986 RepID=U4KKE7_ALTPJ|nr:transcription termination factor NusA [Alteracholeplasma palmae]ABA43691.1 NusA [Alteracholeplasma palmae J233]CCV64028.1 Transcription termination factor NusA [Alteracholeplasma palmae J233]